MVIWLIFAVMTGLAIGAVLWPLSRRTPAPAAQVDERSFYEQRLAEIDRDVRSGHISATEADAARAEAARRLLRESRSAPAGLADGESEYALRRRRAASAIALSGIPLMTLAIYGALGSPDRPSLPVAERRAQPLEQGNAGDLVARIERHLVANPEDGAGWELLAPVYLRLGRAEDSVKAWANVLRLRGETPARLAGYGEAVVTSSQGVVEAFARELFERAAKGDGNAPMPKFYLAVALAQDGDIAGARKAFEAMLRDAPADAPWRPVVEARLAGLQQQDAARDIAAMPGEAQGAAIAGMVDGLAQRLKSAPDDPEGWRRLLRAYVVLGRKAEAEAALAEGVRALAARPDEAALLQAFARDQGVGSPASGASGAKTP